MTTLADGSDPGYFEIDPELARNTDSAADAFGEAGAIVDEVRMPWTRRVFEAGAAHYAAFPAFPYPDTKPPEDRVRLSAPAPLWLALGGNVAVRTRRLGSRLVQQIPIGAVATLGILHRLTVLVERIIECHALKICKRYERPTLTWGGPPWV